MDRNYSAPLCKGPLRKGLVTAQKENTHSVLLHASMFDAVIGQIEGEPSRYDRSFTTCYAGLRIGLHQAVYRLR